MIGISRLILTCAILLTLSGGALLTQQPEAASSAKGLVATCTKEPKAKKPGTVRKVIKLIDPSEPEKAEIEVPGEDDLYKEIRRENELMDSKGKKVKLKPNAQ